MFEHEMEESKKVCNRMDMCLFNPVTAVRPFSVWQIYFPNYLYLAMLLKCSFLNKHLLRADRWTGSVPVDVDLLFSRSSQWFELKILESPEISKQNTTHVVVFLLSVIK